MPRDEKRPGHTLGFGLPEPDAEPGDASVKDALQALNTKVDELNSKVDELLRKRGKPRDGYADAFKELSEVGDLVLRDAIKHVLESVPLGVQVAVNMSDVMDQVAQTFDHRLSVVMKSAVKFHYEKQRKVKDAVRAERNAKKRRSKIDLLD